jgi:putative membrane-bound dehydrogenase-like protein
MRMRLDFHSRPNHRIASSLLIALAAAGALTTVAQDAATGPETEHRFPPLRLAEGFEASLFACDPLVEYPSVIALGPRFGSLFVAQDYMTGLGTEIVKRDEIRLIEDGDGDGYADKTTLFAEGFNSIQGLARDLDGTVFAMHAPFLTSVRDTDGDGVADERNDIVTGLGLPPEKNDTRLHAANGVTVGHDGWLYLALGDHGCDVLRPEGDRLVLEGGGVLRCRPDGRDLHVFSTGLRNIYDVALDADLNVFVRDNENDGGDYKIRVYHTFFGADHGYPYYYYERPEETMKPLADLDLGSSAGGACYLETAFPPEFRGNLFFCDWNHSLVRYECRPQGSSFAPMEEFEVAAGAEEDRYPFKPSDVIVDWDGSLVVSDWADGQRPKRGRARIYRITHKDATPSTVAAIALADPKSDLSHWSLDELIGQLNSESYYARVLAQREVERRGKAGVSAVIKAIDTGDLKSLPAVMLLHCVWILAHDGDEEAIRKLLQLGGDSSPRVRVCAIRALGDLFDPVLKFHRLDARHTELPPVDIFRRAADSTTEPRLQLEAIVTLGRMQLSGFPEWLVRLQQRDTFKEPAIAHGTAQAIRRSQNWLATLKLLDLRPESPLRMCVLHSLGDRANSTVVDSLLKRLKIGETRREYVDLLSRVHRKPAPWVYWNYRPAPRPVNRVDWERTAVIAEALNDILANSRDRELRSFTLQRMQREQIPVPTETLENWLANDRDEGIATLILESLRALPANETAPILERVIQDSAHAAQSRLTALELLSPDATKLPDLARTLEDGAVLASVIAKLDAESALGLKSLLFEKVESPKAEIRAATITALGKHMIKEGGQPVLQLLADPHPAVRRAAVVSAGKIPVPDAADTLLKLAADDRDSGVRRESLEGLRALRNGEAISSAIRGLENRDTQLAAVRYLAEFGAPEHAVAIAKAAGAVPTIEFLDAAIRPLAKWQRGEEIARLHGTSGHFLHWKSPGPVDAETAGSLLAELNGTDSGPAIESDWQTVLASGSDSIATLKGKSGSEELVRLAVSDVNVENETPVQFLTAASHGKFQLWLNGKSILQQKSVSGAFLPNAHRIDAALRSGRNQIVMQSEMESPDSEADLRFHLRFRRRSSSAKQEQLTQAALSGQGNADRGRRLFFNPERSQCLACHQLGDQGGKIGPELTGVGGRFSRIYLIESILDPNANVTPGFKTLIVTTKSGAPLVGAKVSETETSLTLGDAAGQLHEIAKSDIAELDEPPVSLMPAGLENLYTEQEFLDLMAFLISQK